VPAHTMPTSLSGEQTPGALTCVKHFEPPRSHYCSRVHQALFAFEALPSNITSRAVGIRANRKTKTTLVFVAGARDAFEGGVSAPLTVRSRRRVIRYVLSASGSCRVESACARAQCAAGNGRAVTNFRRGVFIHRLWGVRRSSQYSLFFNDSRWRGRYCAQHCREAHPYSRMQSAGVDVISCNREGLS
jgi:hypothetical protein